MHKETTVKNKELQKQNEQQALELQIKNMNEALDN